MSTVRELERALRKLESVAPLVHDLCGDEDTEWLDLAQVIDLVEARLKEARHAQRQRQPRPVPGAVQEAGFEIIPTPGARIDCSWWAR